MNINITIDRFEGDKAVLKTEDGQSVVWPKNKLPENAHESMVLNFNILNDSETEKDKKELAKEILNEILNTEH
jgi:hypothetical protein